MSDSLFERISWHRDRMMRIGTAGWSIPKAFNAAVPANEADAATNLVGAGTHLERYARVMNAAEINTSFHRPHRLTTYARWAAATPDAFRFSVKLPKAITHDARLVDVEPLLDRFLDEVAGLGTRLGVLLAQLPPSLAFDEPVAANFFAALATRYGGALACEPRHRSWFSAPADALLRSFRVARVAADPATIPDAAKPGGWLGPDRDGRDATIYHRWHGSPRVYWSAYDDAWLAARGGDLARWHPATDVWCIFDNTAAGAALADALRLRAVIAAGSAVIPVGR